MFFTVFSLYRLEKVTPVWYTLPISSFLRQLKDSPKALSFGAALFLVATALASKSLAINDFSAGNKGILGGPVALAAPIEATSQASLDTVMGAEDPAGAQEASSEGDLSTDLSTGTLDGTQSFQAISAPASEKAPTLVESNQELIKTANALAGSESPKKEASRYFIQPTSGRNWGILHDHNAVDIANSCGTPVLAAAEGTVIDDPNLGPGTSGWNGGYGYFILLKHPNGTKTRYAHLSKIEVSVGDQVEQGQEIGKIGNTGHVQGETGCHLHFEVLGAPNPFAH